MSTKMKNSELKTLKNEIKKGLKAKKITMLRLTAQSGVAHSTIYDFLAGRTNITLINFMKLCEVLELRLVVIKKKE